ncbi:MAG: hypothetical protein LBL04_10600 [Bacteroidales bacterium]|jgi:hypothetical protein|nr:hypothetical protein [Bacteroidales bacterium]
MSKYSFIFVLCFLLLSCKRDKEPEAQCETACECVSEEMTCYWELAWNYPVEPGTEEWKELGIQGRLDACQIPEDVLSSLSTADLTEICLQYPLLIDLLAFNCKDEGIDRLFINFNGIRELFKREEASKELLKRYRCLMQSISILGDPNADGKGKLVINIAIMNLILSRYHSQNDNAIGNYRDILRHLLCCREKVSVYSDEFIYLGVEDNYFSRANIIVKMSPQSMEKFPNGDKYGVFCSGADDKKYLDIVDELSYQLIK